ncbi:MAG: 2-hydroxyacyl-CoA dehydratase, partial [Actinomycetia bacterium]|nr:2-hydroxyacyl-CoA dehydratase [Actinomycetes bacterium]
IFSIEGNIGSGKSTLLELLSKYKKIIAIQEPVDVWRSIKDNKGKDMIERYINYTFPYDIYFRLKDIEEEIAKRNIDGIIHYTQSFCFRSLHDIIVRKKLNIPIITIEGDKPSALDERTKIRLRTFIEMLSDAK